MLYADWINLWRREDVFRILMELSEHIIIEWAGPVSDVYTLFWPTDTSPPTQNYVWIPNKVMLGAVDVPYDATLVADPSWRYGAADTGGSWNELHLRSSLVNPERDVISQIFFTFAISSGKSSSKPTLVVDNIYHHHRLVAFADLNQETESFFYGTIVMPASRLTFANGGFFNDAFRRYQWKDRILTAYHGDGGNLVAHADERKIGTFRIESREINPRELQLELLPAYSVFEKKLPTRQWQSLRDEDFDIKGVKLNSNNDYVPILYGHHLKRPATFLRGEPSTPTPASGSDVFVFRVCEGDATKPALSTFDAFYISFDDGDSWTRLPAAVIDTSDTDTSEFKIFIQKLIYLFPDHFVKDTDPDTGELILNQLPNPDEDFLISVDIHRYPVDPFLVDPPLSGILGRALLNMFQDYCGVADAQINTVNFVTVDRDFPCEVAIAIGDDGQETVQDICRKAEQSSLSFIRMNEEGELSMRLFSPNTPVLDILEKEIIDIGSKTESVKIYKQINIKYALNFWTGKFKEKSCDESEVPFFEGTEIIYVPDRASSLFQTPDAATFETYLVNQSDAFGIAFLFLMMYSRESFMVPIVISTRGMIVAPTDTVSITRAEGWADPVSGFTSAFTADQLWLVRNTTQNLQNSTVSMLLQDFTDLDQIWRRRGHWMDTGAPDWTTATPTEKETSGFWTDATGDPTNSSAGMPTDLNSQWWR